MVELTNKDVICKKQHQCIWCGEIIVINEKAHYRTGIYDGDFFSEYWHLECYDALKRSDLGFDNEFYPMEQARGKTYEERMERQP